MMKLFKPLSIILLVFGLSPGGHAHDCVALDDSTPIGTLIKAVKEQDCVQYSATQEVVKAPVIVNDSACSVSNEDQLKSCFSNASKYDEISLLNDITSTNLSLKIEGEQGLLLNGNGFTIKRTDNQRAQPFVDMVNSGDITFKDITLDDDASDAACVVSDQCANMIYLQYSNNVVFDNVSIENGKRYVVYTRAINGFEFVNSRLENSGVLGMYIGHDEKPSTNVLIDRSEFFDNSTNAVALLGATDVKITNNTFKRNHNVGQWPVSAQYGTGMTGGGQVYIAKASNVLIDSNVISDGACSNCKGGVHGIELSEPNKSDSVANVTITNNTLNNNTGTHIYTNSGAKVDNLVVKDNVLDQVVIAQTTPSLPTPTPEVPVQGCIGACTAWGNNLNEAKALFAQQYPDTHRADCDPVDGGYLCSSETIGSGATKPVDTSSVVTPLTSVAAGTLRIEAESVAYNRSEWKETEGGLQYIGLNRYLLSSRLDSGNLVYNFDVPVAGKYRFTMRSRAADGPDPKEPPNDVWIKAPGVEWFKVYMTRDGNWHIDAIGEIGKTHSREFNTWDFAKGGVQIILSGRSQNHIIDWVELVPQGFTVGQVSTPTTVPSGDLVVLNYDSWPDQDDHQAVLMGKAIVNKLGIEPTVVIGSWGENGPHLSFIEGSVEFWRSVYPNVLDAHNFKEAAASTLATQVTQTIRSGNKVSIAEGGPSDFTARVLRKLPTDIDKKKINVYQHSVGATAFNEAKTLPDNLAYVKASVNYVAVANGNIGGNGSADFQEPANSAMCQRHISNMKSTALSTQWVRAFSLIGDSRKCDGSDTVELLTIVGDTSTKTFDDFYARYIQ